mmetsp:Transcript_26367/g.61104  ORF Transcript_26367/g.61104 Transcript_26367/m.61104 type:complete len:292 (+) Transcript_26367:167-1042(+)
MQHVIDLCLMDRWRPGGRARGRVAPDVRCLLAVEVLERGDDAGCDVAPRAHVLGLLLDPHDLGVGVALRGLEHLVVGEGTDLLDADDGHVVDPLVRAGLVEVIVDPAAAENDPPNLLLGHKVIPRLTNQALEARIGEGLNLRRALRESEQALGGNADERLAEVTPDLTPEEMKVVGGRGWHHNLHVDVLDLLHSRALHLGDKVRVVIAKLKEPLQAGRGVLRALTLKPMGKKHHESRAAEPLLLARGNELINDDLCRVGKVTKLRLPHDKAVGVLHRVPQLEPQHGVLGQV